MDDSERFRCQVCGQVPETPHHYNPYLCTGCGLLVCGNCGPAHQAGHPKSPEELFREAHAPKAKAPAKYSTAHGDVNDDDIPF